MAIYGEEDAVKLMEEMTRFEAEIGGTNASSNANVPARPIIGANTFDLMQKKLESAGKSKSDSGNLDGLSMSVPPPPPPPSGSLPSGFPAVIPPAAFAGIPPPPPPPPFMVPHNVRTRATPMTTRLPPPPPPLVSAASGYKSKPIAASKPPSKSVVLSAAPTKYDKNDLAHLANMDEELNNFFTEIRKEEEEMNRTNLLLNTGAKKMAEAVKASTVISTQPVTSYDDSIYGNSGKRGKKNKKLVRMAGGQVWEDPSLVEWEDDDFRIFCGDLGNDVTDEVLTRAFNKYPSFLKAKVIRDKRTNKTKGFGFVSFKDPQDFIKAMKEMNGRYVGSRPIKLRKSTWKARSLDSVKKKEKEKAVLINLLTGR